MVQISSIPSLDIVDKFQSTYPDVTPTAMPIASGGSNVVYD